MIASRPFQYFKPWLLLCCIICSYALPNSVNAQTQSVRGNFQVAEIIGCAPFTVTPEILYSGNIGTVVYRYDNTLNPADCDQDYLIAPLQCTNGTDTNATSFTYDTPGTYYLLQIIGTSGNPEVDYREITVVEPVQPEFETQLCNGNEVTLNFNFGAASYDSYNISWGDGNSDVVTTNDPSTISHAYLTQGNYDILVSGQLSTGNSTQCGTITESISTLSNIPTPQIDQLTAISTTSLTLNYTPLSDDIAYRLEYSLGAGAFVDVPGFDPQTNRDSFTFDDPSIDNTNQVTTFRIIASDGCGSTSITSNEISSIALNYQLVSVTNQIEVNYNWITGANDLTDLEFYQGNAAPQIFTDPQGTNNKLYALCTEITEVFMQKLDQNNALVQSLTIVPFENENYPLPQMATPTAELDGSDVNLTFANTLYPYASIRVYRKNGDDQFEEIGTTTDLDYTDFGVSGSLTEACYVTDYLDECGNIAAQSEQVCVPLEGLLRVPSAFSPNDDGTNDIFIVATGVFDNFQLAIFNKWGSLVFQSNDPAMGWDGNFEGKEAPMGAYLYKISYRRDGLTLFSTGTITLIR